MQNKSKNSTENQLFMGIIKFYDAKKEFGFILTNSFGMKNFAGMVEPSKIFFSKSSIKDLDLNDSDGERVVFNLIATKGKTKAINVRKYDYSKYKKLALSYCIYMNNIYTEHRVKKWKKHYCISKYEWVTEKETISIFSSFHVQAIDVLNELINLQKKKGDSEAKKRFVYILSNVWKSTNYFSVISKDSDNSIKQESIKFLECISTKTAAELVHSYPLLRCIANSQILQEYNNLTKISTETQIEDIISTKSVFNIYFDKEDKRKLKRNIIVPTPYLLRLVALCSEEKQQDYILKITEIMKESVINYVEYKLEKCNTGEVLNFKKYYSQFVDGSTESKITKIYDEKVVKDFCCIFNTLYNISNHNLNAIYDAYGKLTENQKTLANQFYKDYYLECANLASITSKSIDEFVNKIPVPIESWKYDACQVIMERANERIVSLLNSKDWIHDIRKGVFQEGLAVKEVLPMDKIEYYKKYSTDLMCNDTPLRLIGNAISLDFIDESAIDINKVLAIRNFANIVDRGNFKLYGFNFSTDLIVGKIKEYLVKFDVIFNPLNEDKKLYIDFIKLFAERNSSKLDFIPSSDKLELLSHNVVIPISIEEVKDELLKIGPRNCSETLFNHQYTPEAICRIVSCDSSCGFNDYYAKEKKEWLKLLLLTNRQNYVDKDEIKKKFFDSVSKIAFNSNSFDCGVSIELQEFIPPINEFSECYDLIAKICNFISLETYEYDYQSMSFNKIEYAHPHLEISSTDFNESELETIIAFFDNNIFKHSTNKTSIEASLFEINEKNFVKPYLATRVLFEHLRQKLHLNNISFETLFPLDSVRTREYYQMVSNIMCMSAWSGKSILYRVGDRNSYVDVGESFSVEFASPIDFRLYLLFKRIQYKLELSEDNKKISYSDILSYGTWSLVGIDEYDNTDEYKDRILSPMVTTVFYSYMIGC